jgi:uncharacterized membrane protein YfcA
MENKALLYFIIGILSGFFVGLVGIGAGVITIPGLTLAGLSLKQSVTTGLLIQAVPITLPGFLLYKQKGHFEFGPSVLAVSGALVGIIIGSYIQYQHYITDKTSYVILASLFMLSGVNIFYRYVLYPPLEKEVKKKM